MTPDNALRQAHMTAHDYTMNAVSDLCGILNIERGEEGWREKLAPFAAVLAAMVTAAAMDFDTATKAGVVDSYSSGMTLRRAEKEWLHNAVESIDEELGKGYAKEHPELVGAVVQALGAWEGSIANAQVWFEEGLPTIWPSIVSLVGGNRKEGVR